MKSMFALVMFFILAAQVFAAPVVERLEVDDTEILQNAVTRLAVERDQEVEVEVRLFSQQLLKNVEVEAFISGFEYNDVERLSDVTPVFDMDANVSYVKHLKVVLPDDVEEDDYKLRLVISDRDSPELVQTYNLKIDVPRHAMKIEDVLLSPGSTVKAGSSLLATIRLENKGEKDEEDVKVSFSIPELGVSASDYIDEVENSDDEEETEELFVRLPRCAAPGTYTARVDVSFDNARRSFSEPRQVTVLENEQCASDGSPQLTISVGSAGEAVQAGGVVVFPLTVVNTGRVKKSVSLVPAVSGFATVHVTPKNTLVLDGGDVETVYVNVQTQSDAPSGTQQVVVQVLSGGKTLSEVPLSVSVVGGSTMRRVLEVGVLGLLVVLVLLGLMIGLSRLRPAQEEPQEYHSQKL